MEEEEISLLEVELEISLLEVELVQLSVKTFVIVPKGKFSLLCTVWTKKTFNPHSFRA